ncbi:hypothetical protein LCGC14_2899930, partial [marine sediment metagenome]
VMGHTSMRVTITDGLADFINIDYIGPDTDEWEPPWDGWESDSNVYDVDSEVPQNEWYHVERNITNDVDAAMKSDLRRPFDIFEPKFVTGITFFQGENDIENEFHIDAIAIGNEGTLDNLFVDYDEGEEGFI